MIILLNDRICLHVSDAAGKEYRSGNGVWVVVVGRGVHSEVPVMKTALFNSLYGFCRILLYLLWLQGLLFAKEKKHTQNTYMCVQQKIYQ